MPDIPHRSLRAADDSCLHHHDILCDGRPWHHSPHHEFIDALHIVDSHLRDSPVTIASRLPPSGGARWPGVVTPCFHRKQKPQNLFI
jgi:hypothetical protein